MEEALVFVVDVGLFLLHFPLRQQISDISFLQEPFKENFKHLGDSKILRLFRIEKKLKVAWTCNSFNF